MDWIELDGFRVDCVVGVLPDERRRTQPVDVQVRLGLDLDAAGDAEDLTRSVDYAEVRDQVRTLAWHGQWRLLETLALAICRLLLAPPTGGRASVERVEVSLRKPTILEDATPGVRVSRDADWCDLRTRMALPRAWIDVLVENSRAGAYRVHVDAGTTWEAPPGAVVHVLQGEPVMNGKVVPVGQRVASGAAREVGNPTEEPVTLLVVAIPPLED